MSRDLQISTGGFPIYDANQLRKVNAMRRAFSAPESMAPVVNTKGEALFVTAEEMHDEPASCYNCHFYNGAADTCQFIGKRHVIKKIIWPMSPTPDSKQVEFWPCCSLQTYGEPNMGEATYIGTSDPDYIGLIWINAPKLGQAHGGANCAGINGGDDCDHYTTDDHTPKWESTTGFCRALQTTVAAGDVCCQWRDDDTLQWQDAERLINQIDGKGL